MNTIRRFLTDDDGPTAVEYAVMLAMIIGSLIVSIKLVGSSTSGIWAENNSKLDQSGFNSP
ncbi:Flp family type IVb pilin [Planctomicrobium sp. SH668]|uniref:Flp family type IVb pilin n=1 Tax=Planctomicrobium sp. SH668 TaxID=3448126 RepID=UPI003F5BADF8